MSEVCYQTNIKMECIKISFRWVTYPVSPRTGYLGVFMAPGSQEWLDTKAAQQGRALTDSNIPVAGIKINPKVGSRTTSIVISLLPNQDSPGLELFKGWGMVPLVLVTSGDPLPPSEDLRKELFCFLRASKGQNGRPNLSSYYTEGESEDWPAEEAKVLKPDELWPEWRETPQQGTSTSQGKKTPKSISGTKYSRVGGFTRQCLSPTAEGLYGEKLISTANHSLATNTWRSYTSVVNKLKKISLETGVEISFPLNKDMIQVILGFLLTQGLKASTIQGYMSSLKHAHMTRGSSNPLLEDGFIQQVLKGAKNRDSLEEAEAKAVVTIPIMGKIWEELRKINWNIETKRMIWAIATTLFMGSLRPSEILCIKTDEYDEAKSLLWSDVKFLETKVENKKLEFLQLRVRHSKTSKSMPEQIIEIPEVDSKMCAVQSWKKWMMMRKRKQDGNIPVFTSKDGSLVTVGEFNRKLAILLPDEIPKITARAFRPALATIMARQGASQDTLKSLGRWSSKAFQTYIRKGRANNWKTARIELQKAITNH